MNKGEYKFNDPFALTHPKPIYRIYFQQNVTWFIQKWPRNGTLPFYMLTHNGCYRKDAMGSPFVEVFLTLDRG
jgi:hypothetical protein